MLRIMKKEVKFLTENSQDNEKKLSFKEQILKEFANSQKNEASSNEEGPSLSEQVDKALAEEKTKEDPSLSELLQQGDSSLAEVLGKDSLSADSANESQAETTASQKSDSFFDEPESVKVPVKVSYKNQSKEPNVSKEEPLAKTATYRRDDLASKETLSRSAKERQANKKKRQNNVAKKIVWTIIALLLVTLAVTGAFVYSYIDSALKPVNANDTEYVTLEIPAGSSAKEIGSILEKKGLIKSGQVFNYYSKFKSYANFQSGYYNLQKSMDLDTIAKALQKGGTDTPQPPTLGKLVVPEGYTLNQIAEAVEKSGNKKVSISAKDFLSKVQDESFISKMVAKYPKLLSGLPAKDSGVKYRLEGYLFPATYNYTSDTTAETLIDQMLATMDSKLSTYYEVLESKNLTVNDVLTLASLVEKEGSTDEDRKNIASVFYNRLNQGMPLQSNIAILYAEGKLGKKTTLAEDAAIDTNIDSAFNVYKNPGLMPGPVDSPSLSAIEATVNPNKTDYLYFVANTETGTVYFATTYEEHAKNVEEHVNSKLTQSSSSN
ncbi:aminodeoxychorismate lyase [Streptococcus sp. HMSC10A01]|uniref:endolytic transglycosylase MltG n=1 Tax=Streptococcus TaxID=1301 RepID=UPI0007792483|nr:MULTISPECIES: endolytic transglycosylase MltG [Streptococcus]OFU70332.1 aminodeoxychorismate lyase [Streptococcus sp. HMSC10A01]